MSDNLFTRFRQLLPGSPLLVGAAISQAGGVAVIELPGGARIEARGAVTVGLHYFVRAGAVEGEAPSLSGGTVEV